VSGPRGAAARELLIGGEGVAVTGYVVGALGLCLAAAGLALFVYPKPPPLDFAAFLGGHPRLMASLSCIVLGGAVAPYGLLAL